ncbi:MAG TPA: biotin/lipoyl-containing protein [Bryobacteraceae bacterium]|jgi:biotin carboxyl carrier protein
MKVETRIGGRAGNLKVEAASFRYEREDGAVAEGEFSLQTLEPGCVSVLIGGRSYRVTRGAAGEMMVNGQPVAAEVFDPRSLRSRKSGADRGGRHDICAPMPGKIVRVLVEAGDAVKAGQGLVVVEAMKMQNEMKSPKAGRVVEVRTKVDAAVSPGEVLMVVE